MGRQLIGDVLLDNLRLTRLWNHLLVDFPKLTDRETVPVSWIQEPFDYRRPDGLVVPLERVAVLAVQSPDPQVKTQKILDHVGMWFSTFREKEVEHRHDSQDWLYPIAKSLVRQHLQRLQDMSEMNWDPEVLKALNDPETRAIIDRARQLQGRPA
jgi:hypothetical protein